MSQELSEIQTNILTHIPNSFLEKHFTKETVSQPLPSSNHFRAILLSTNILHFSHITLYHLKNHPNGLDIVSNIHKQFIELTQEHIRSTGADMLRYSTDRILFFWGIPSIDTEKYLHVLSNVILFQVLQLKQALKEKLSSLEVQVNFSFILTEGTLTTLSLGENQQVTDYIHSGSCLLDALVAPRPDADESLVLVSNSILQRIQEDFHTSSIDIREEGRLVPSGFSLVRRPFETCMAASQSIEGTDLRKLVTLSQYQDLHDEIGYFIPKCLDNYIMEGIEVWGSETRKVSVAYFLIPFDIEALNNQDELERLQQIMKLVHIYVQVYQGYIYRTYLDEKGFNMFVVFGLYPDCHPDNSVHCILASLCISEELNKLECPIFVGISTGEVLLSVCGTYQRDLFIIGDCVHTAFTLGLVPLKGETKSIMVDYETKAAAEMKLTFRLYKNPIFTGKVAEEIYEVIYSDKPLPPMPLNLFPEIRTHLFNVDYSSSATLEDKVFALYMVGRETELQSAKQIFYQFVKNPAKPSVLLVVGSYGIGKSLFAKHLLESINETVEKSPNLAYKPVILTSSINPVSKNRRLNGWRFIMREILDRIALSYGQMKEDLLYELLDTEPDLQADMHLLKDILDLNINYDGSKETFQTEENQLDVPAYEQKIINKILIVILKRFLGEKVTFGISDSSMLSRNQREMSGKESAPSLIICLDDLQEHDELSWSLLMKITKKLQKIFIIGLLRDEEINPKSRKNIEEGIQILQSNLGTNLNKITLESLKQNDVANILKRMTGDREVGDEIKKFIVSRCEGNPLVVISLLENMMKQSMLQITSGVLFPTESLQKLIKMGEYIEIHVPSMQLKLNGMMLDRLSFLQYNLLKVASIIGETFDLKTLVVSNPFHNTLLNFTNLMSCLQELRRVGILDLADNKNKNTIYKFAIPFLRETLYQRVAPFLKRRQHRIVALCNEDQVEGQPKKEEKNQYHWQLSEDGQENKRNREDIARRTIMIKKMNAVVSQPMKRGELVIKVGQLEKKSQKTDNKWSSRFLTLTQNSIKFYRSEQDFHEKPVFYLGLVPLKQISAVSLVPNQGASKFDIMQKPGFKVHVNKWEKASQEVGSREFFFGCGSNQEAEEWQICIEYVRNRAVYEDFLQNSDSIALSKSPSIKSTVPVNSKIEPREKQNIKMWLNNQDDYELRDIATPDGSPNARRIKLLDGNSKNGSPAMTLTKSIPKEGMSISKKQKNRELVKTFLSKGQILFWSYLCNAPFKGSLKGKGFGKNPNLLLAKPDLLKIDPNLVRAEPNMDFSQHRRDTFFPKLPSGLDRAITDKLSSFDKGKIEVKPNTSRSVISQFPTSYVAQKFSSQGLNETIDSLKSEYIYASNNMDDLNHSKTNVTKVLSTSPEKKKMAILPNTSYRDDSVSELVEEVTKNEKINKVKAKQPVFELNVNLKKEIKNNVSTKIAFEMKGPKVLSRPNIYGRYEFFPTFFIDSCLDDKIFVSKNNQMTKVSSKTRKLTKNNIPNNASMMLNKAYEDGEEVYYLNEESHERTKNHAQRKAINTSRLEDETPIYKSPIKTGQDFTSEKYSLPPNRGFGHERLLEQFGRSSELLLSEYKTGPILNNSKGLYPGRDSVSSGHARHKSDILGTSFSQYDNDRSMDMKESSRLTPTKSRPNDLNSFVLNRPGTFEDEKKSSLLSGSPMDQNQSVLSRGQMEHYVKPAKPSFDGFNKLGTSYQETSKTPKGFSQREGPNDAQFSSLRKYNDHSAQEEMSYDRHKLIQNDHNLKSLPMSGKGSPLKQTPYINEDQRDSYVKDYSMRTKEIPKSTSSAYMNSQVLRQNNQQEPQFSSPAQINFAVPTPKEINSSQSQQIFKPLFPAQSFASKPSNPVLSPGYNSGESLLSFASPLDPRSQKISPASHEKMKSSITVNLPKGIINPSEYFSMAYTKRDTVSQDGDIFTLPKREFVVVTRVYEKRGLAELLWNGLSGLFPLADIELVSKDDQKEVSRDVTIGTYEQASKTSMSPNYFVGYNPNANETAKNERSISPLSRERPKIDTSAPRFGASVDYGSESLNIPQTQSKIPNKMMMRQMKKMQDSRGSNMTDDSGLMSMRNQDRYNFIK